MAKVPARVWQLSNAALAKLRDQAEATGDDELLAACEEEQDLRDYADSDPANVAAQQAAQDEFPELPPAWWEFR